MTQPAWDGSLGIAGGTDFGGAIARMAQEAGFEDAEALARACGLPPEVLAALFDGHGRLAVAALARIVEALRTKPIEFMQRSGLLSLEVYAFGLDPLYFLPEGPIRYDARIYMREINPRHAVPEADMTKRNPALRAIAEDSLLDPLGKIEMELTYLLRVAAQQTGGSL
ncbi:MAG: hypothetical protein DLM50_01470 [Candidatus Meridianibacter frigidus]|nr:MAG: hypothetical protein DLM50_01470 [Candidatus Eremiobacteraeota bacterium]